MLLFTFSTLSVCLTELDVIHTINHMNLEVFLDHVVTCMYHTLDNFKNTIEGESENKVLRKFRTTWYCNFFAAT